MASWLDKIKGKTVPPAGPANPVTPAAKPAAAASPTVVAPPAPALDEEDGLAAALSEVMGLEKAMVRRPAGVDTSAEAEAERLLPLVRAHFDENRPEPSSFPSLAMRVIDLVEQPNADLTEVARLIERDPAISANVLRVANSALYRRETEVETVRAAITHLGLFQVANLAVGVACKSLFDVEAKVEYELFPQRWSRLSHHAMTCAFATSWFAMNQKIARFDQAFMSGMFHDIGKTVSLSSLAALVIERKFPRPDDLVINALVDRMHIAVGMDLLTTWGLPKFLATMCEHHHDIDVPSTPDMLELQILRVVSGMNELRVDPSNNQRVIPEILKSARALKLNQTHLQTLSDRVQDFADKVTSLYGIPDFAENSSHDAEEDAPTG